MEPQIKDFVKLHFVVLIWGFTAILGNEIQMPTTDVVLYRTGIAAIVLFAYMRLRGKSMALDSKALLKIMGTGLIIAAHWFLFFESARVSTVSVCLAGMATTTFWTSLVEPLFTSRRVRLFEVVLGLVVISGLYVVFRFEFDNALGLLLAIGSALMAAMFSVINSKFTHRYSPYTITLYEMAGACIGIFLFIPAYKSFFLEQEVQYAVPGLQDVGYLLILSIICTVYAFSTSVELMKRISAFAVNLTINLEPIYGILLALLIYGENEKMSAGFYWGTLIILVAVLTYPMINKRLKRKALESDVLR